MKVFYTDPDPGDPWFENPEDALFDAPFRIELILDVT